MVHFNILDGSLLVDGKSHGTRLPNEFVWDLLYKLIFGEVCLPLDCGQHNGYLENGGIVDEERVWGHSFVSPI